MTEQEQIDLRASLTEDQAYALAELCKRIGWVDVERVLAVSDEEARHMIIATNRVRSALELVGVSVR